MAIEEARRLLLQETPDRVIPIYAARADALVSLGRAKDAAADIERAFIDVPGGEARIPDWLRAVRRRFWVASGQPETALQDFRAHPREPGETNTAKVRLHRQTEEAELLLAGGHAIDASNSAAEALASLERMSDRRFERDTEARLTAVLGFALLSQHRSADALPVLRKALTLHLDQYDSEHSPAVARVRRSVAEAKRSLNR